MMREVPLETLANVNIRDPSHDKNLPIMSVTGSINRNIINLNYFVWFLKSNRNKNMFKKI